MDSSHGPSSTLVWYFNGHGESGEVISSDSQTVSISGLLSDMKKAGVNIRRMMIITSACYSGKIAIKTASGFQLNDAPVSIQTRTTDLPHSELPQQIDAGALPTLELFALTAARTFEPSLIDFEKGDVLTLSLLDTWKRLKVSQASEATVQDLSSQTSKAALQVSKALVEKVIEKTGQSRQTFHVPMFAAYQTSQLLSSYLFKPGMKANSPLSSIEVDTKNIHLQRANVEYEGLRFFKQKYTISLTVNSQQTINELVFQPVSEGPSSPGNGPCSMPTAFRPVQRETVITEFNGKRVVNLSFELNGAKPFYPEECPKWVNPFEVDLDVAISDGSMVMMVLPLKLKDYGTKVVTR